MPFIKISSNKSTVHLPIKDNSLSLQTVRAYFPNASGLTFAQDNKKCGLSLVNDKFELMPGVEEYEVFSSISLPENNGTSKKKKRFDEIMNLIEGNDEKEDFENQENQFNGKNVTRKLSVAWKHKDSPAVACYEQMKGRLGGIKTIELDGNKDYSVEDIKSLSIAAMKNNFNESILRNSVIQLGTKEDEIINSFTVLNGKKCKFWEFVNNKLKPKNYQIRIFLLSIGRTHEDKTKVEVNKRLKLKKKYDFSCS